MDTPLRTPHIPPRPTRLRGRWAAGQRGVPLLREVSAAGLVGLIGAWGCAELALLFAGV